MRQRPLTFSPDDPLGWLSACHDRIEHFLGLLERLPAHLEAHGPDAKAQDALFAVQRYFAEAAPLHHADEEEDVYPALRIMAEQQADVAVLAQIRQALAEHGPLETLWRQLRPALQASLQGHPLPLSAISPLIAAYRAHIRREEEHLFPAARRWLDPQTQHRLAQAMAQRRRQAGPS